MNGFQSTGCFLSFEVSSRLRGYGQVTKFGLLLSTPHAGEVLEMVEIMSIISLPSLL